MISIIIPAHNEEKRIGATLEAYGKFFHYVKEDVELVVVINNTQDKTEEVVKEYQERFPFIGYLNFKQGGKGFAIKEGFNDVLKNRTSDLIGFVDADMATTPEAYYDLIKNIGDYAGIIASRYVKGAVVNPKQSMKRILGSRLFNVLVRTMFMMSFRDTQCGCKLFTRKAIESVVNDLSITQWAFDVNLLYKLKQNGFKIKEHPTTWSDKEYSKMEGFVNSGTRMALACIRLRLINSRYKFIMDAYDRLPNYLKISLLLK
jgi:glycosyltransferase involved in cell wall biosynthesis